jgi:hypothetical protein
MTLRFFRRVRLVPGVRMADLAAAPSSKLNCLSWG